MNNFTIFSGRLLALALLLLTINLQAQFCDEAQLTPGFPTDINCQNAVCAADPFCCDTEWDLLCANAAAVSPACIDCLSSGGGTPGCTALPAEGISDCDYDPNSAAYAQVIADDAFCCDTTWDILCQTNYEGLGGLPNPSPACTGETGESCEIIVTVESPSWGDGTNWTLTDATGAIVLSGGDYGNGFFDSQTLPAAGNGPYTFFINSTIGDNSPNYSITVNGVLEVSGTLPGATSFTQGDIGADCTGGVVEPVGDRDIVVTISSPSWGDGTTWTLTDNNGAIVLSGGTYANGFSDTQTVTEADNGPYTLTIVSTLTDNSPNYTVNVGGNLVVSGVVPGATTGIETGIAPECGGEPGVGGCTYTFACNYDPEATFDDGSCEIESCTGCAYPDALNYNPMATFDDGSCVFDLVVENECPGDINEDGVINTADLIIFLGVFGTVCE